MPSLVETGPCVSSEDFKNCQCRFIHRCCNLLLVKGVVLLLNRLAPQRSGYVSCYAGLNIGQTVLEKKIKM